MKRYIILFFFSFVLITIEIIGQEEVNKYGLRVISDSATYVNICNTDTDNALVSLDRTIPNLKFDIRYATVNNFAKKVLYKDSVITLLRRKAVIALKEIANELERSGIGIVVFDAYRPYSVTEEIWEFVKDDRYAANPAKGSRHNRGCAIDLTLYDLKSGKYLTMPTEYDDFTERAHHDFKELPEEAIRNRELLQNVMNKYGFESLSTEWWHYDFSGNEKNGWRNSQLLDLSFKKLKNIVN